MWKVIPLLDYGGDFPRELGKLISRSEASAVEYNKVSSIQKFKQQFLTGRIMETPSSANFLPEESRKFMVWMLRLL